MADFHMQLNPETNTYQISSNGDLHGKLSSKLIRRFTTSTHAWIDNDSLSWAYMPSQISRPETCVTFLAIAGNHSTWDDKDRWQISATDYAARNIGLTPKLKNFRAAAQLTAV